MSVYSKRLFELDFPLASGSTVFTAPAGFTTVIRCISGWVVWSTSTGFVGLYDAATGNEGWVAVGRSPARDAILSNFRWVLNAGDVLKFESDGVAGGSVQVSGYVLA